MGSGISAIVDGIVGGCVDGYVEKHTFRSGARYVIKPSNMFIELHVISEGDNICVEIWDNETSAAPVYAQSFKDYEFEDSLNYIICRIYQLLMLKKMMSIRPESEIPLNLKTTTVRH
ncbi:hypothetical protein [Caldivirga sp. UBA161]|uniref:hypothetical protein n=1 Tax=Caldivirga sp. UBA161 TaxID=1915569 RepID=UPI0025BC80BF|nr:hypothetical protein [Caldivirga sp. UBA161]